MRGPSRLRTSAAWIIWFAWTVTLALAVSTCTNKFSALYAEQGGAGGGAGAPAVCWDGGTTGDLPTPPSETFMSPCAAPDGCRNATEQPSNFACNVCGGICSDFQCAGDSCEIWCGQGTTCHQARCNLGNTCTFYCDGCDGQIDGSALVALARCTAGARCDLSSNMSTQDSFEFECSNSQCKFLVQATNIKGSCEQNSTCDIDCRKQNCTFDVSCDETSTCIIRCDTKDASSCPAPDCGGEPPFDCGADGWRCNATSCST